jgi:hypothetical protein
VTCEHIAKAPQRPMLVAQLTLFRERDSRESNIGGKAGATPFGDLSLGRRVRKRALEEAADMQALREYLWETDPDAGPC